MKQLIAFGLHVLSLSTFIWNLSKMTEPSRKKVTKLDSITRRKLACSRTWRTEQKWNTPSIRLKTDISSHSDIFFDNHEWCDVYSQKPSSTFREMIEKRMSYRELEVLVMNPLPVEYEARVVDAGKCRRFLGCSRGFLLGSRFCIRDYCSGEIAVEDLLCGPIQG